MVDPLEARRADAASLAARLFPLAAGDALGRLLERSATLLGGAERVRACHDWLVGESLPRALERRGRSELVRALAELGSRAERPARLAVYQLLQLHWREPLCAPASSLLAYDDVPAVLNNVRGYLRAVAEEPVAGVASEAEAEAWTLLVRLLDLAPATDGAAVVNLASGEHGTAWRDATGLHLHEGPLAAALAALPHGARTRLEPLVPAPWCPPARISTPTRRHPASCRTGGLAALGGRLWLARPYGLDLLALPDLRHLETWPCEHRADALALGPDARWVAVLGDAGADGQLVTIADGARHAPLATFRTDLGGRAELVASPDGRRLAVVGPVGARVWSLDGNGRPLASAALACRRPFAFSPDGAHLYEAAEGAVRVRALPRGDEVRRIAAPRAEILALAVSPDGRALALAAADAPPTRRPIVRLVDLASLQTRGIRPLAVPRSLVFEPGGWLLVVDERGHLAAYELASGTLRRAIAQLLPAGPVASAEPELGFAGSSAAPLLVARDCDAGVRLFDLRTGLAVARGAPNLGRVEALGFVGDVLVTRAAGPAAQEPHGLRAFSARDGGEVPLPDDAERAPSRGDAMPERGPAAVSDRAHPSVVCRPPDARGAASLLALGFPDGRVELWDAARQSLLWSAAEHRSDVSALAFDAAGARLASADRDGLVRVWDVRGPDRPPTARPATIRP
ncbi:MAG: WD40 repeat domain-containing protein [Myxococcales bacterium]|nr:WD40 repeat domain-containing protein [Myxococcales bacterium]